jgi:hypothetical protein
MTTKKLCPHIFSLCLTVLLAGCQTTTKPISAKEAFQAKLVGTYKGIIASGVIDSPGVTRFFQDNTGTISGNYEYADEQNVTSPGTLKECKQPSDLNLHCQWVDKYGTGDLKITFDANATKFTGTWNLKGSSIALPWNGAK